MKKSFLSGRAGEGRLTYVCRIVAVLSLTFSVAIPSVEAGHAKVVQVSAPAYGATLKVAHKAKASLTGETKKLLSHHGLPSQFRSDPDAVIRQLHSELNADTSDATRLALIDLCHRAGLKQRDAARAAGYFLAAAQLAYEGMSSSPSLEILNSYNQNCGEATAAISYSGGGSSFQGPWQDYSVKVQTAGKVIDIAEFAKMAPSADLKFQNIDLDRKTRAGVGAAMVGHFARTEARATTHPFLFPQGMVIPLNVTLEFGTGKDVRLYCRDSLIVDSASVGGSVQTLSADFTAPLALMLSQAPRNNVGWDGMLHPDEYANTMGLFQMELHEEDRIPIVFVHGLMSSPQVWIKAMNELRADPNLRKNYQVLVFYYPTGFPIVYNAHSLRDKMQQFQEVYDPRRRNPNMRNIIMIGHSMGGQLTNSQIRTSGDTFTKKLFDRPIEDLGATAAQKKTFRDLLVYDANPDITRAVFLASPHRGSELATGSLGKLGMKLIKFPLAALGSVPNPKIEGLTPLGQEIMMSRPSSIESLAPNAPGLTALLKQPVRSGVKIHSVIGNHKLKEPLEDSTDTVVPYWSSHLDYAVSEVVVDATHTTICQHEDAIEEVRRILYLHAGIPER